MTIACNFDETGQPIGSRIPAQTLFLGASVLSYSANMGWGGQTSSVTVELINDFQPGKCLTPDGKPIPVFKPHNYPDNHYFTCRNDECYVDENGDPYNSNRVPPPIEKKIPGKVYYAWTPQGFVSRYWYYEDPGFFGESTKIGLDGNYLPDDYTSYDIIGVPVYFCMDSFIFGGVVQSWEKNNRQGQITYSVTIDSMDQILDSSWIILKDYGGSIFTKIVGNTSFGAPINYVDLDQAITSAGSISEGALPNVFNVYGFLESFGINNYGGASITEEGIACADVLNALSVLTSCVPRGDDLAGQLNDLNKRAFSPFGRILTKTIQENGSLLRPSGDIGFGVISPSLDINNIHRTAFALDLSELPIPPSNFKISGDVITVMDLIRTITGQMGRDFYTTLIPCIRNGIPYNIIKLKVIDRNQQPAQNQIPATLTSLQEQGYSISIDSMGKEWSQSANPRVMYIGGKQERIYQAKNYRLGYKQAAYVYDPFSDQIINFHSASAGKIKIPTAFSTRNPYISIAVNGADTTALWDSSEEIHRRKNNLNFDSFDGDWVDSEVGGSDPARTGNYNRASKIRSGFSVGADATGATDRYIPIYMDVICPFFGYASENKINISTNDGESNNFRKIRPVWLDSWTGQLVVICDVDELPPLTIGTSSLYRTSELRAFNYGSFLITETELRAAMAGFDSYFSYCYAKSIGTKPQLFLMLMTAYYYANPDLAHGYGWARTGVASGVPWLPPGFSRGVQNNANSTEWEYFIDPAFIKDLMILTEFVANLGRQYYGQKYMVRIPELTSYRDRAYADIEIPASTYQDDSGDTIAVFAGTGKIYFNIEPCDSGWEEPGNVIDDSFVIGSEAWYALMNDQGKLPALLGYNASYNYDYEARKSCGLDVIKKSQAINANDSNYNRWFLSAQGVCDDSKFVYPSLNLGTLSKNDFVVVNTSSPRVDAFNRPISAGKPPPDYRPPVLTPGGLVPFPNPDGMSKKLFLKAQHEGIAFMDPMHLAQPRVIMSSQGVTLNPPSLDLSVDPTRTVLCNAALEDLIVYLKMTIGTTIPYDPLYVHYLLNHIRGYEAVWEIDPRADAGGAVWNVFGYNRLNPSRQYAMLAEKCAHPHFAAIPLRYNQFTYGPWTNYPVLIGNDIFLPGIQKELESLVSQRDFYQTSLNKLDRSSSNYVSESQTLIRYIEILNKKIEHYVSAEKQFSSGYAIENIIGNTKIEINGEYVPWNYGGMAFLDQAIISYINSNTDFQTILETSQVSIAASPLFGLGGEFKPLSNIRLGSNMLRYNNDIYQANIYQLKYKDTKLDLTNVANLDNIPIVGSPVYLPTSQAISMTTFVDYDIISLIQTNRTAVAPIISNLSVRFDSNGFNTSYSFKSYARKLGLYAKEQSDRLKKAAENNLKTRKSIIGLKANTIAGNMAQIQNRFVGNNNQHVENWSLENKVGSTRSNSLTSKLFGTSPTEVLIGAAQGYVPLKEPIQAKLAMDMVTYNPVTNTFQIPDIPDIQLTGKDPGDLPVNYNAPWHVAAPGYTSLLSKMRHSSWVGMYQHWETKSELDEAYNQKAAMSLDGIFSPVSFYPTIGNTTYAMLPYNVKICPYCNGTQIINMEVAAGYDNGSSGGVRKASPQTKSYVCPACTRGVPDHVANAGKIGASGANSINLQPIVVPYLEWQNYHAQPPASGERKRHSIQVVGRNHSPPYRPTNGGLSLNINLNKETFVNPNNGDITVNGDGINPDFANGDVGMYYLSGKYFPNNQRFFALRGPLMMHGWGYDTSGYPVPNAADEPMVYDGEGRPKRFFLTSSGTNDYSSDGAFTPQGGKRLGDIIGKGWSKEDGKWVRKPSNYFYLNWAERPDLWPVGPIDLRWDYEKRVWSGGGKGGGGCSGNDLPPYIIANGTNDVVLLSKFSKVSKGKCSYKMVYITLEENLIKEPNYDQTYPTRGFIDDIQYSTEAMPNNSRKLVFVKDKAGYTAPRGAKLLCRYDSDSGFYEPVSKQTYFVFGTISGGNNAIIDLSYIQGQHRGSNTPTMQIVFDNSRFNFDIGSNSTGMFYFENGKWILISCKEPKSPR